MLLLQEYMYPRVVDMERTTACKYFTCHALHGLRGDIQTLRTRDRFEEVDSRISTLLPGSKKCGSAVYRSVL